MIGTEWGPAVAGAPQAIDNEDVVAGVLLVDGETVVGCRVPALADDSRVAAWVLWARGVVTPEHPSETLTGAMLRVRRACALGAPC